jgi:hypothetical protein
MLANLKKCIQMPGKRKNFFQNVSTSVNCAVMRSYDVLIQKFIFCFRFFLFLHEVCKQPSLRNNRARSNGCLPFAECLARRCLSIFNPCNLLYFSIKRNSTHFHSQHDPIFAWFGMVWFLDTMWHYKSSAAV